MSKLDFGGELNKWVSLVFFPGEICLAVFFIIMGYFGVKKDHINIGKIISQTLGCALLTVVMTILTLLLNAPIQLKTVINSLLKLLFIPVSGMWWFVPVYLLLCFMAPRMNRLIRSCGKKQFLVTIILVWGLWYGLGNLCKAPLYVVQKGVLFYLIGAYFQIYGCDEKGKMANGIKLALIWICGMICAYFGCIISASQGQESMKFIVVMWIYFTFIVPAGAVEIFLLFHKLSIQSIPVNSVAKTVFGIYLLHDSVIARVLIWNILLNVKGQFKRFFFPVSMILSILMVFVCCGVMSWLINRYIAPIILGQLEKLKNYVERKLA